MEENKHTLTGVVYAKYTVPWKTGEGESHYVVMEHKEPATRKFKDKKTGEWKESYGDVTNFIPFRLSRGLSLDDYSIKDPIRVTYKIRGNKWDKKDGSGEGFFVELEAREIKFTDIDERGNRDKEETAEYKSIRETFTPPDPDTKDDDGLDDLPFIWTILVAIGTLSPFIGII